MDRFRTWGKSRAVRLPGPNSGPGCVAVTMVVQGRRKLLVFPRDVAGALDEDLGETSPDGHARVLVACVMPDHIHVLLSLDGEGSSVAQYVRQWKSRWTRRLCRPGEAPLWQRSFYDHWMRSDEASVYATYIVGNPVRKAMVEDWQAYPYTRVYVPL